MSSNFIPDPSQLFVIEAAPEARFFVTAAAGQGKTEVVLSRIDHLVENGLNPADEILVLSFSRAAIEAVSKRAKAYANDNFQIRTFDSLAAQIILDEEGPEAWTDYQSFEARIRRATEIIANEGGIERIDCVRHLIIDEAQDLVGDRAEMVLAILNYSGDDLGLTILGDPLQGIYDFQLDGTDSVSKITSNQFVNRLSSEYKAQYTSLKYHYRAQSSQTKELIVIGDSIRSMDLTAPANIDLSYELLTAWSTTEGSPRSFLEEQGALEPADGETTALLCSTNYEVLIASQLLWAEKIPHIIRRRSQDMSIDPWVHSVFKDLEGRTYDKDEILHHMIAVELPGVEDRWANLKAAEGDSRSWHSLDVSLLGTRLRNRSVPLSLTVSDKSPLTLSTVHRSKGLEFTNVLYVPPPANWKSAAVTGRTLRQKYVALTRAREFVVAAPIPKGRLGAAHSAGNPTRWLEDAFGVGRRRYTKRMEIINSDVDDTVPMEASDKCASDIQGVLARKGIIGEAVHGTLDTATEGSDFPRYILAMDSGEIVGRTSAAFSSALKQNFSGIGRFGKWPPNFYGARVTSIECATGRPEDTQFAELGQSGMWLVPRLVGLITKEGLGLE